MLPSKQSLKFFTNYLPSMRRILQLLFPAILNLNCNLSICDFELLSINSFNKRNPRCELTGCFFRLSQCMWRKIQEKGCST
ncbi:hypothetical protein HZS_893 [Henneguya salminicola]|nr:hypothetical protein HZS_893 [Henneguya salminicola]